MSEVLAHLFKKGTRIPKPTNFQTHFLRLMSCIPLKLQDIFAKWPIFDYIDKIMRISLKKACFLLSKFSRLKIKKAFFCLFFVALSLPVQALKIYFPDEELATESVLPLTNKSNMILNRNVPLKKGLELSMGSGIGLTEPFYYHIYPQIQLGYSITNVHSIHLLGSYYFPWLSGTSNALVKGVEVESTDEGETRETKYLDPQQVPYPQYNVSLNYQYTPFYGKISLSKNFVLNLSIYSFAGGGLIVSDDNNYFPLFRLGIGQKLYFLKWSNITIGLRGDLGMEMYYGPAVARLNVDTDQRVSYQNAEKKLNSNVVANIGVLILLSL